MKYVRDAKDWALIALGFVVTWFLIGIGIGAGVTFWEWLCR